MRRVVVTGIGVVSPVGISLPNFYNSLKQGKSGIGKITQFDPADQRVKIAGEVKDFEPTNYFERKEARKLDRFCQFAIAATMEATEHAKIKKGDIEPERFGVILGSGIGGIYSFEKEVETLRTKGPNRITPHLVPKLIANMAPGNISIMYDAKGPVMTIVTACASATHAIGESYEIIKRGDADVIIAGGAEAPITPLTVAGFASMKAITSSMNDDPEHASRPFDLKRDGFVIAEGAGILILEEYEHAIKRGAPIIAEILGFGFTGDAFHITAPDSEARGAARAMAQAISKAGLKVEEIDYINAHGTSTPLNDKIETLAIKKVFGDHAYKLKISSTKSMTGHLLGAAGAIEAIATLLTLSKGEVFPTINLTDPDPDCDLDYVPNKTVPFSVKYAMSNSFGFGGHNGCLVFKKFE